MRLPNGFGQISKIKNRKLRNPYRAMVTVGKTETGRPIVKPLKPQSYFKTYNDAYTALLEYHKNPYDLSNPCTVKEIYDKWYKVYSKTASDATLRSVKAAWERCEQIYDIPIQNIRVRQCKDCMNNAPTYSTKAGVKSLLSLIMEYAIEDGLIEQNYAKLTKIDKYLSKEAVESRKGHIVFTAEELDKLWKNISLPFVSMLLIQCYSGWRPQELCALELRNVDLTEWTITGGMKTDNGKNRTVPIHKKIRPLVEDAYDTAKTNGCELLFCGLNYRQYVYRFKKIIVSLDLNPDHRAHDPRKTFVTLCKKANVDEYAIKKMVGHSISDLTEKIYTDRDINWLREELDKV